MRTAASRHLAADQALSRAAEAPLIAGNAVRLLRDGAENYPAWLAAIAAAERFIHFDRYIVHDDRTGRLFADALVARARAGVEVRAFNPPSPWRWRGCRAITARCWRWMGRVAFVSGLRESGDEHVEPQHAGGGRRFLAHPVAGLAVWLGISLLGAAWRTRASGD